MIFDCKVTFILLFFLIYSKEENYSKGCYDEECTGERLESTELLRTKVLESLHLTFNLEAGLLLPLAIRYVCYF